jgi:hypothetical protein
MNMGCVPAEENKTCDLKRDHVFDLQPAELEIQTHHLYNIYNQIVYTYNIQMIYQIIYQI